MAFVDEITITAKAGKGGDGVVRWLHEYQREFGGPSGGDGGKGGDVFFRGTRDIGLLARYRGKTSFKAGNGEPGSNKEQAGKDGADVVIDVPVGAYITRASSGTAFEILEDGQTVKALIGGRGGIGNARFKSSTNQYPDEAVPGKPGEEDRFLIELRLIADIGLVGLPNAGKSSLLNALTNAHAKVGAYAFTTLEPSLGVFHGYTIADIPGLIEGAAEGKGLGHKFLRHIARTRLLIHCLPADAADPLADYTTVRHELERYSPELSRKPEMIFLTKADTASAEMLDASAVTLRAATGCEVVPVSVIDDELLAEAARRLSRFLESAPSATFPK